MAQSPKRFYRAAGTAPGRAGWTVTLDDRPLRTPARAALAVPSEALARAIAAEWDAQADTLDIASMHLTRLANVAIDRTPAAREAMADEVAKYCETDLTCHLAESPEELRARQEAAWAPVRAWAGRALGVMLVPVNGIMASPQPDASLQAARAHVLALDDFRLTGLAFGCGLFGSALLALALEQGEIDAPRAHAAARIDEDYQAEQWGRDAEAETFAALRRAEAEALGQWFAALDSAPG